MTPRPAPQAEIDELPLEVEEFLTWLRVDRGRATNTLVAYRSDLRAYLAWLRNLGRSLAEVGEADVAAYVGRLRDEGRSPASVKRAVVAVRSLHRFVSLELDEGRVDPAADVAVPAVPRGLPKALSEAEVGSLLGAVDGTDAAAGRDRAILEVLYGTGLRISELVGLSLGDLDLEANLVRALGKGSRERVVPIGRFAAEAVAVWLELGRPELEPQRWARRGDAEAVFLSQRGRRLTRQGAWAVVRKYGDRVGLGARLTPHVLRHSCATHMLDHGADIRSVQELLGHASISTTQLYTLVSTERLWSIYQAAHPRAMGAGGGGTASAQDGHGVPCPDG